MEIVVDRLHPSEELSWDNYVLKSENSTFFHQAGWKNVIEMTYGLSPYYFVAKKENEITGILPFFKIDRKLISLPFAPYGGPLADDSNSYSILLKAAFSVLKEEKLKYFELRNFNQVDDDLLESETLYNTFLIDLDRGSDFIWQHTSKSARRLVNKAIRSGMTSKMDVSYINDFYNLYAIANRDFGTPVHSDLFFKNILKVFPNNATVQVAILDNRIIGAKFLLFHKKTIVSGWAVTDKIYKKLSPNGFLTWEIIQYGSDHRYEVFDFGRSELQTGSFNFKNRWGDPRVGKIFTQYCFNNAQTVRNVSKFSKKRKLFSLIYRSLPLPVTVKIGPYIRKHFP